MEPGAASVLVLCHGCGADCQVAAALRAAGLACSGTTREQTVAALDAGPAPDAILVLREMSAATQRQFLEDVRRHPTLGAAPVMLVGTECAMDPVVAELLAASLQIQVGAR